MSASAELAAGLTQLRSAVYYKRTRANWPGTSYWQSLLGQAETKFMTKVPTRPVVEDGIELLQSSWAYQKTKRENPNTFAKTAMGKAEAAFKRARDLLPAPVIGLGLFAGNGVFCINPQGGVENADEFALAGFRWAAANVGDFGTEMWETWRRRMIQYGIVPIPWRRCYVAQNLIDLIAVANQWAPQPAAPTLRRKR